MQFTTTVTQKGQATIPVFIRRKLGIKLNGKVSFEINGEGGVFIKPVSDFLALRGSLKNARKVTASSREMRAAFEQYLADEAMGKNE